MFNETDDALGLLGRVADAFDRPTTREHYKGVRVDSIRTHHPQTSYSSCGSQVQHARFTRCDSSFDVSYIYDDNDIEGLGGPSAQLRSCSSSETVTTLSRIPDIEDPSKCSEHTIVSDDLMKMLLDSSPLDRLNHLARAELKKAGWFERSDKWSTVNQGLSPSKPSLSDDPLPLLVLDSVPNIEMTPPKLQVISDSPRAFYSPDSPTRGLCSPLDPEIKFSTPNGKFIESVGIDDDPDTFDSNFPDFSTLSYDKPLPHIPRRRFGRVKNFVKRVLASSGASNAITTVRNRHSLLVRTPPPNANTSPTSWSNSGWHLPSLASPGWIFLYFCFGVLASRPTVFKFLWPSKLYS
ncbi:hypothetical protein BV22DRAFT_1036995 [Leucogyrophana mollusca]|uniref:Uncharacterized protein n=1 Tax=Leucogyrophana mollusca TaxID=85980 RepID=A0ACB8BBP8_9AGAM|nr:hypothetical protein BV22DRAFT_1036995 [Leucogyrophana mollusca]